MIKSLFYDISTSRAHSKLNAENQFHIGRNCSHIFYNLNHQPAELMHPTLHKKIKQNPPKSSKIFSKVWSSNAVIISISKSFQQLKYGCKGTSLETEKEQIRVITFLYMLPKKLTCDNLIGFLIQLFPLHMVASHASTSGFSVY